MRNFYLLLFIVLQLQGYRTGAQALCGGSVGDPIVHISFGSGSGFGAPLTPGTTTYRYNGSGEIEDGEYTLVNNIQAARSQWHSLPDHTPGDVNGYMLAVNADYTRGEFYRAVVSGLCQHTTFEFSAWIANANTPETCAYQSKRPNVVFRIEDLEGRELGRISTGEIPPSEQAQWVNYGFVFNSGEESEVVLIMENNNEGGCGNDLAIDDITFRACGPALEAQVEGSVNPGNVYVCAGSGLEFSASIASGFQDPRFKWQFSRDGGNLWEDIPGSGDPTLTIQVQESLSYRAVAAATAANLSSPFCSVVSGPVRINVVEPLRIEGLSPDQAACLDEDPFLEIQAAGGHAEPEYQWERALDENGPWTALAGATDARLFPGESQPGTYYYRCRLSTAALGCESLLSPPLKLEILAPQVHLDLAEDQLCADSPPLPLSGGSPARLGPDQLGFYSGPGIVNGHFDPRAAGGPGRYEVVYSLSNTSGCQYIARDYIEVYPAASAEAGPDKKMLQGTFVSLEGQGSGSEVSWSPALYLEAPDRLVTRASPPESMEYILSVRNGEGCVALDTVRVEVLSRLDIPNAFSPNHDGVNDTWEIAGVEDYPNVKVKIFNRWGAAVFESEGYGQPWDGRSGGEDLPPGVYYYLLQPGIFLEPLSGSLTIVR